MDNLNSLSSDFGTSSDLPGRQVFAEDNSGAVVWSSDGQVSSK